MITLNIHVNNLAQQQTARVSDPSSNNPKRVRPSIYSNFLDTETLERPNFRNQQRRDAAQGRRVAASTVPPKPHHGAAAARREAYPTRSFTTQSMWTNMPENRPSRHPQGSTLAACFRRQSVAPQSTAQGSVCTTRLPVDKHSPFRGQWGTCNGVRFRALNTHPTASSIWCHRNMLLSYMLGGMCRNSLAYLQGV